MIVDGHTHIWTGTPEKKYFPQRQNWHVCMDWAYSRAGRTPPYTRDPNSLLPRMEYRMSDPECKYTIATMDQAGVDAAVVFTIDYDFVFGEVAGLSVEEKHRIYGEFQRKYPGRLLCTAGPEPRRFNSLELYKRAIEEHKLRGIKLVPASGYYAWDPILCPIYEYSLDNNQPVWFCTEVSRGSYRYTRFQEPVHISDMMHDFPDLTVVLAHMGACYVYWFEQCLNAAASNPNVYLQDGGPGWVLGWSSKSNPPTEGPWCTAFNNEPLVMALLARAKAAAGSHRILWGNGSAPGPAYAKEEDMAEGFGWRNLVKWWRGLPERAAKYGYSWTTRDVEMILGENAAHVMGYKRDPQREIPHKFGWRQLYPPPRSRG
ncbi:MAG: amidohydrolase family protein [Chloroflexi bacterium]|nr:amidohydrolase family protein [Chloroflexota bacterium]